MRMVVRQLNTEHKLQSMKNHTQQFIMIAIILVLANSGIYFVTAYSQMQESKDVPSQIQTMLFTTAAIMTTTAMPIMIFLFMAINYL